jgi:L-asparaginase II
MPVLAEVVRGDLVESRHRGSLVVLDPDGADVLSLGDPDAPIYPRSCAKPLQLGAMLDAGLSALPLDQAMLAIAAASHSGQPQHVEQVRRILAAAGLGESDLDNTPGLPLDGAARRSLVKAGGGPDRLHHNCSGKHAAMLATCVTAGWERATYRDPAHPLQQAIRARIEALAGERAAAVTVDGCGAPLLSVSLRGLARAFGALVASPSGSAAATVATAMRARPDLVGGDGRDVTALMLAVPDLTAKDGAEGVYAAASPSLGVVAVKIEDGSSRARAAVMVAGLQRLGADVSGLEALATSPVLGHGVPVGRLAATF